MIRYRILILTLLFFVPCAALAQDAGVADVTISTQHVDVVVPTMPSGMMAPWQAVLAALLGLLVLVIRKYDILRKIPDPWDDVVSVAFFTGIGSMVTILQGGTFTWPGSIYTALLTAISAVSALITMGKPAAPENKVIP